MRPLLVLAAVTAAATAQPADEFLWLEDVEGDRAMEWVEARNAETASALQAHPAYDGLYADALAVLTSDDRIAYPSVLGDRITNFWTDADNPRGVWRETTWEAYLAGDPAWETLLDVDALGAEEGVPWAYKGATCLAPDYDRCLVRLSRGGADAVELREFDRTTRTFVEGGFRMPEAKLSAAWIGPDELLVSTAADGATASGYPRAVKRWRRGTPLADAETVFEADAADVSAWAGAYRMGDEVVPAITHSPRFFERTTYLLRDGDFVALDVPLDASPSFVDGQMALYLRSDWAVGGATLAAGTLVAIDAAAFLAGDRAFTTVFAPTDRQTVEGTATTRHALLVSFLDDVQGRLRRFRFVDGAWAGEDVEVPPMGSVDVVATSDDDDRFFFQYSSFLQPSSLYLADGDAAPRLVTQLPEAFDASGLTVRQLHATSADGTRVPYFVVHPEALALDGSNPTQLYGYGGFEVSLTPSYSGLIGKSWLERGGVYVLANIRGGGEFGPAWHRSAQRENRQRAFDDFIAVAEDLVARGITSPEHLGIRGGSNGGLLVGAVMTQRPELMDAVVISVPLLDMRRYHTLLAGASWMAEYGDPDDPADWAFISAYSPYQNLDPAADYPVPLFTTTTRDDRVHPGHARKMAARMLAMGHAVDYVENTEGGHGSGVTPEQQATMWASIYSYLWRQLGPATGG